MALRREAAVCWKVSQSAHIIRADADFLRIFFCPRIVFLYLVKHKKVRDSCRSEQIDNQSRPSQIID